MNKALFFEIQKENIKFSLEELQKRLNVGRDFDISLIGRQFERVKDIIKPRCCYNICNVISENDTLDFGFMKTESTSLIRLGSCYKKCVFFAVTLGLELEREQTRLSKFSPADLFITDACGSCLAEDVCNTAQETIKNILGRDFEYSRRFSPGYSDFALEHQGDILTFLDAKKLLGITLLDSLLMIPQKSITAVMFFDRK